MDDFLIQQLMKKEHHFENKPSVVWGKIAAVCTGCWIPGNQYNQNRAASDQHLKPNMDSIIICFFVFASLPSHFLSSTELKWPLELLPNIALTEQELWVTF